MDINKAQILGACLAPVLLPTLGFTEAVVTASSIAAALQSAVHKAFAGGVFSVLQSAGTCDGGATLAVMAGGGAVGWLIWSVVDGVL
jgi:hypothetical protein